MNYAATPGGYQPNPGTGNFGGSAPFNFMNYRPSPSTSPAFGGGVGSNQYGSMPPWMNNALQQPATGQLPSGGYLPTGQTGSFLGNMLSGMGQPAQGSYGQQNPLLQQLGMQGWSLPQTGQMHPQLQNLFNAWMGGGPFGGGQPQSPMLQNMFNEFIGNTGGGMQHYMQQQAGQNPAQAGATQQMNPLLQYMMRQMGQTSGLLGGVNY